MDWLTQTNKQRRENKRLLEQAERLLRRIRQSPKLWDGDTAKIERVLLKAKARMMKRRAKPTEPYGESKAPRDRMLFLYE